MKRRRFLKNISAGVAVPSLLGGFGIKAFATSPVASLVNAFTTDTDHVLVMIQLSGGNDGLNTLVPLDQYDRLQQGRPDIILPQSSLLPLTGNSTLAWHPALSGLRDLYNEGQVRVVQSVGYPNPNYSHFRATDIWHSGADSDEYLPSGWAGRYLAYEYPNFPNDYPNEAMPHPLAIEVGDAMALSLMGPQTGMGYVIANPDEFYNLLAGVQDPAPNTPAGEQLAYVRLVAQQSRVYSQAIVDASANVTQQNSYPDTELAAKLKIVARLIAGGLKTRMYVVTIDGFDTHDQQVLPDNHTLGEHANLLKELGDAIKAFSSDLDYLGVADRVTGMTYSEFGRRIAGNFSGGTDHGEAAPMFLFGKPIAGGVTGNNPVIPNNPTDYDSLDMQFDFRSVYGTLLRDWFCVPESDIPGILLHDHPYLGLIQPDVACIPTAVHDANNVAGQSLLNCSPNPFSNEMRIQYRTEGGPTTVQILDTSGRVVATPQHGLMPAGDYSLYWSGADLPAGTYLCRLLNGVRQQVKMVVKVR